MISDLIALITLVKGIRDRRRQLNREYFVDFITPTWDAFNRIHNDYLISFKEYAELICSEDFSVQSLLKRMQRDHVYSQNLRSDLLNLSSVLPMPSHNKKEGKPNISLARFILALREYFDIYEYVGIGENSSEFIHYRRRKETGYEAGEDQELVLYYSGRLFPSEFLPNFFRIVFAMYLHKNGDKNEKVKIEKKLDELIQIIQLHYNAVSEAYFSLKSTIPK
ncbi:MAG: hypothetical protein K8L97_20445 [Anaerolineae bacterium]|nr:hypothetical protein [Anaerolineae bacterium]